MRRMDHSRSNARSVVLPGILALVQALALAAGATARAAAPAAATDWPAWRGADRTGISRETGWRTDWSATPRTLWRAEVGEGYSSVSVAQGRAYTMGNTNGNDTVWCFDAESGRVVWKQSYPCKPHDYPGSRCSPTVDGGLVYTLSNQGHLNCFAADTGKVVWQANVPRQFSARAPQWGFACSPLVLGDLLIVDVGPILALKKATGELAWKGGTDMAGYASPVAFQVGADTLLASFNANGPIVVSAADGKVLGRSEWKTSYDVNAVTPIVVGNTFFISSGYGKGAAVFEVAADGLKTVWQNKNMRNHANNCVLWNGHLYGFDGQVNEGALTCIEYKTGEKKWSERGVRAGALMLADGKLICMSSKGEIVAAEPAPDAYKELGRAKVLDGTCWTMPVLSGGRLYVRNHPGLVLCLDVRAAK